MIALVDPLALFIVVASTRPVKNLQQEQVRADVLYDFLEKVSESEFRSCVKVEVGRPGLPVPNDTYGFYGHWDIEH